MPMYTVHARASELDRPRTVDGAAYVREGFSWGAFLFLPLWCVFRRSWLGLVMWVAAVALIGGLGRFLEIPPVAALAALVVVHILFGFEAAQLRRRSLARRNFVLADVVSGHSSNEAEITFALRRSAQPEIASMATSAPAAVPYRPRPVSVADGYGLSPLGGGA